VIWSRLQGQGLGDGDRCRHDHIPAGLNRYGRNKDRIPSKSNMIQAHGREHRSLAVWVKCRAGADTCTPPLAVAKEWRRNANLIA
jgi:hypothetical protein